jgi:hypothetical protein
MGFGLAGANAANKTTGTFRDDSSFWPTSVQFACKDQVSE